MADMNSPAKRPASALGSLLREKGYTLCLAESCTGGITSGMITSIAGSSDYFTGSLVAYDNSVKRGLLGVGAETLERYGAVSDRCAKEMAAGAKDLFNTEASIAITGIAGPGGGTDKKPVGTVYVAVCVKDRTKVRKLHLKGTRHSIRNQAAKEAISMLLKALSSERPKKDTSRGRQK